MMKEFPDWLDVILVVDLIVTVIYLIMYAGFSLGKP